jgi:hypothetical protein
MTLIVIVERLGMRRRKTIGLSPVYAEQNIIIAMVERLSL